ncbi:MAG: hypothetical protein FJX77_10250 [Armatimonadetes bacterium]|nr:hypothetical protein [Armatimonadota bacterium]
MQPIVLSTSSAWIRKSRENGPRELRVPAPTRHLREQEIARAALGEGGRGEDPQRLSELRQEVAAGTFDPKLEALAERLVDPSARRS